MGRCHRLALLALAGSAVGIGGNAWAEDTPREAQARALFDRGIQMAEAERWSEAEKDFARADALVPRASTAFNRALALYRLGRLREMVGELERFLERSDATKDAQDRAQATSLKASGEAALGTLVVSLTPPEATLEIDGEVPPSGEGPRNEVRVDPGDHRVVAAMAGYEPASSQVSVSPGERVPLSLTLRLSPPPAGVAPKSGASAEKASAEKAGGPPVGPLVLTVAGAAAFVAAGVTGALALSLESQIDEGCSSGRCYPDLKDDEARMKSLAATSDWLTVGGVLLAGAGITWWVLAPSGSESPSVSGWVGPAGLGLKGRL